MNHETEWAELVDLAALDLLKEERELRRYLFGPENPMNAQVVRSLITALRRAVYEDCANIVEKGFDYSGEDGRVNLMLRELAAAIRGRGRK